MSLAHTSLDARDHLSHGWAVASIQLSAICTNWSKHVRITYHTHHFDTLSYCNALQSCTVQIKSYKSSCGVYPWTDLAISHQEIPIPNSFVSCTQLPHTHPTKLKNSTSISNPQIQWIKVHSVCIDDLHQCTARPASCVLRSFTCPHMNHVCNEINKVRKHARTGRDNVWLSS